MSDLSCYTSHQKYTLLHIGAIGAHFVIINLSQARIRGLGMLVSD
jgi:hypothetical protein